MKYWLVKTEPTTYSIDDLKSDKTTCWDGVRNYQARNFMKDMQIGDQVFVYHSNAKEIGIVGLSKVSKLAYPDKTAFDKKDSHYDPKSKPEKPTWFMVDLKFAKKYKEIITLDKLREKKALSDMFILRKGNRLSVTPVAKKEFEAIEKII